MDTSSATVESPADSPIVSSDRRDVPKRVRVLQIVNSLNYGGMERMVADLVRRTDPSRFDRHILALSYLGRFSEGLEDVASLHVARRTSRWSFVWPRMLARQIQTIAPDVVHTHSGVWYKASLAARLAGVRRVIHTEHGRPHPDSWDRKFVERLAARRTDVVVTVSAPLAAYHRAERIVPEPRKIRMILNGVDTEAFRPRPDPGTVRQKLGIAASTPVLGSIGRLETIKGYDVMVEAFRRLSRDRDNTPAPVLLIGGEGLEGRRLETLAASHGLRDRIRFLGWRDDVHDLHATFTLFTLASRSEGTSVSLLEAMSAGLCPVVTDVGGNADILGTELAHRLVPAEDPERLADAWRDALEDATSRERDARAARSRVIAEFSLDAMVRNYEHLYAMDE